MKILKFLKDKKGQVANAGKLTDNLIAVFVFVTVGAILVPLVLGAFLNLSASGIALASLFGSVLGIILAVAIFKGISKSLRF